MAKKVTEEDKVPENSTSRFFRRKRELEIGGGDEAETAAEDVKTNMLKQTLLASAIFLDFWSRSSFPELDATEKYYVLHFCQIEKSLKKIGPWAVFTGRSMFQGLGKFAAKREVTSALKKFDQNSHQNCFI